MAILNFFLLILVRIDCVWALYSEKQGPQAPPRVFKLTMGLLRTLLYCVLQSSLIPILKPNNFGFVILGEFSSSKCPRPAVVVVYTTGEC